MSEFITKSTEYNELLETANFGEWFESLNEIIESIQIWLENGQIGEYLTSITYNNEILDSGNYYVTGYDLLLNDNKSSESDNTSNEEETKKNPEYIISNQKIGSTNIQIAFDVNNPKVFYLRNSINSKWNSFESYEELVDELDSKYASLSGDNVFEGNNTFEKETIFENGIKTDTITPYTTEGKDKNKVTIKGNLEVENDLTVDEDATFKGKLQLPPNFYIINDETDVITHTTIKNNDDSESDINADNYIDTKHTTGCEIITGFTKVINNNDGTLTISFTTSSDTNTDSDSSTDSSSTTDSTIPDRTVTGYVISLLDNESVATEFLATNALTGKKLDFKTLEYINGIWYYSKLDLAGKETELIYKLSKGCYIVATKDTYNHESLKINLETNICDINGSANYANYLNQSALWNRYQDAAYTYYKALEPNEKLEDLNNELVQNGYLLSQDNKANQYGIALSKLAATAKSVYDLNDKCDIKFMPYEGGTFTGTVRFNDDLILGQYKYKNDYVRIKCDGNINIDTLKSVSINSDSSTAELYLNKINNSYTLSYTLDENEVKSDKDNAEELIKNIGLTENKFDEENNKITVTGNYNQINEYFNQVQLDKTSTETYDVTIEIDESDKEEFEKLLANNYITYDVENAGVSPDYRNINITSTPYIINEIITKSDYSKYVTITFTTDEDINAIEKSGDNYYFNVKGSTYNVTVEKNTYTINCPYSIAYENIFTLLTNYANSQNITISISDKNDVIENISKVETEYNNSNYNFEITKCYGYNVTCSYYKLNEILRELNYNKTKEYTVTINFDLCDCTPSSFASTSNVTYSNGLKTLSFYDAYYEGIDAETKKALVRYRKTSLSNFEIVYANLFDKKTNTFFSNDWYYAISYLDNTSANTIVKYYKSKDDYDAYFTSIKDLKSSNESNEHITTRINDVSLIDIENEDYYTFTGQFENVTNILDDVEYQKDYTVDLSILSEDEDFFEYQLKKNNNIELLDKTSDRDYIFGIKGNYTDFTNLLSDIDKKLETNLLNDTYEYTINVPTVYSNILDSVSVDGVEVELVEGTNNYTVTGTALKLQKYIDSFLLKMNEKYAFNFTQAEQYGERIKYIINNDVNYIYGRFYYFDPKDQDNIEKSGYKDYYSVKVVNYSGSNLIESFIVKETEESEEETISSANFYIILKYYVPDVNQKLTLSKNIADIQLDNEYLVNVEKLLPSSYVIEENTVKYPDLTVIRDDELGSITSYKIFGNYTTLKTFLTDIHYENVYNKTTYENCVKNEHLYEYIQYLNKDTGVSTEAKYFYCTFKCLQVTVNKFYFDLLLEKNNINSDNVVYEYDSEYKEKPVSCTITETFFAINNVLATVNYSKQENLNNVLITVPEYDKTKFIKLCIEYSVIYTLNENAYSLLLHGETSYTHNNILAFLKLLSSSYTEENICVNIYFDSVKNTNIESSILELLSDNIIAYRRCVNDISNTLDSFYMITCKYDEFVELFEKLTDITKIELRSKQLPYNIIDANTQFIVDCNTDEPDKLLEKIKTFNEDDLYYKEYVNENGSIYYKIKTNALIFDELFNTTETTYSELLDKINEQRNNIVDFTIVDLSNILTTFDIYGSSSSGITSTYILNIMFKILQNILLNLNYDSRTDKVFTITLPIRTFDEILQLYDIDKNETPTSKLRYDTVESEANEASNIVLYVQTSTSDEYKEITDFEKIIVNDTTINIYKNSSEINPSEYYTNPADYYIKADDKKVSNFTRVYHTKETKITYFISDADAEKTTVANLIQTIANEDGTESIKKISFTKAKRYVTTGNITYYVSDDYEEKTLENVILEIDDTEVTFSSLRYDAIDKTITYTPTDGSDDVAFIVTDKNNLFIKGNAIDFDYITATYSIDNTVTFKSYETISNCNLYDLGNNVISFAEATYNSESGKVSYKAFTTINGKLVDVNSDNKEIIFTKAVKKSDGTIEYYTDGKNSGTTIFGGFLFDYSDENSKITDFEKLIKKASNKLEVYKNGLSADYIMDETGNYIDFAYAEYISPDKVKEETKQATLYNTKLIDSTANPISFKKAITNYKIKYTNNNGETTKVGNYCYLLNQENGEIIDFIWAESIPTEENSIRYYNTPIVSITITEDDTNGLFRNTISLENGKLLPTKINFNSAVKNDDGTVTYTYNNKTTIEPNISLYVNGEETKFTSAVKSSDTEITYYYNSSEGKSIIGKFVFVDENKNILSTAPEILPTDFIFAEVIEKSITYDDTTTSNVLLFNDTTNKKIDFIIATSEEKSITDDDGKVLATSNHITYKNSFTSTVDIEVIGNLYSTTDEISSDVKLFDVNKNCYVDYTAISSYNNGITEFSYAEYTESKNETTTGNYIKVHSSNSDLQGSIIKANLYNDTDSIITNYNTIFYNKLDGTITYYTNENIKEYNNYGVFESGNLIDDFYRIDYRSVGQDTNGNDIYYYYLYNTDKTLDISAKVIKDTSNIQVFDYNNIIKFIEAKCEDDLISYTYYNEDNTILTGVKDANSTKLLTSDKTEIPFKFAYSNNGYVIYYSNGGIIENGALIDDNSDEENKYIDFTEAYCLERNDNYEYYTNIKKLVTVSYIQYELTGQIKDIKNALYCLGYTDDEIDNFSITSTSTSNLPCSITGQTIDWQDGAVVYKLGSVEFTENSTTIRLRKQNASTQLDEKSSIAVVLERNAFRPSETNVISLGTNSYRFSDIYLINDNITVADSEQVIPVEQTKIDKDDKLLDYWKNVEWSFFKYKDAVNSKGEDDARIHTGLIAQNILNSYSDSGLNLMDYGFMCYDEWSDQYKYETVVVQPAEYDDAGNLIKEAITEEIKTLITPAGYAYSIRYQEAQAIENLYLRKCLTENSDVSNSVMSSLFGSEISYNELPKTFSDCSTGILGEVKSEISNLYKAIATNTENDTAVKEELLEKISSNEKLSEENRKILIQLVKDNYNLTLTDLLEKISKAETIDNVIRKELTEFINDNTSNDEKLRVSLYGALSTDTDGKLIYPTLLSDITDENCIISQLKSSIKSNIEALESENAKLAERVTVLESNNSDLNTQIININNDIEEFNNTIEELNSTIEENNTNFEKQITNLQDDNKELEKRLYGYAETIEQYKDGDVTVLQNNVAVLQEENNTLKALLYGGTYVDEKGEEIVIKNGVINRFNSLITYLTNNGVLNTGYAFDEETSEEVNFKDDIYTK